MRMADVLFSSSATAAKADQTKVAWGPESDDQLNMHNSLWKAFNASVSFND